MAKSKQAEAKEFLAISQVAMLVDRDGEKTVTTVYPWEIPILEALHGEGKVNPADNEETVEFLERTQALTPRQSVQELQDGSVKITDPYNPVDDLSLEYERLERKYGMHHSVKQSYVENVYGKFTSGEFRRAVEEHVPIGMLMPEDESADPDNWIDRLNGQDLRSELDKRQVRFKRTSTLSQMRALLREAILQQQQAEAA